jgi:hypothetical protein
MTRLATAALAAAFLGFAWGVNAQELGRLFFTPEQRNALDARRKARVPDKPAAQVVASPTTRVDGYVKRSGGRSTVFVNGEPLTEGTSQVVVDPERRGGRVRVPAGEGSARVDLRPGEVVDRGTGQVRDVLGEGGRVEARGAAR